MYTVTRTRYLGAVVYNVTSDATGAIACYDDADTAFNCADMANTCTREGMSQRHAGIIARAYAAHGDGLFTNDDACAAIERADLAVG